MPVAVIWILLLVALAALGWMVVRRMTELAGRTRGLQQFQREVAAIDARMAALVGPLVARLDDLRRLVGDPAATAADIGPASAILEELAAVGRGLRPPVPLAERAGAIVAELERGVRALDLLDHGLRTAMEGRRDTGSEAQVALKRGTLNLRHARDAVGRLAGEIAAFRASDLRTLPGGGRLGAVVSPSVLGLPDDPADEV
jgi:hypothetical protein